MADYNINLTAEEIDRRLTRGAVDKDQLIVSKNSDGVITTIGELKTILQEWVTKNYRIFNATTSFHVGTNWVDLWNKLIDGKLTDETLDPNTQHRWTVTLIAAFPNDPLTENPHGQLRIASYIDKNIYSITFNYWNGQFEWGKVYKVAFEDEVEKKVNSIDVRVKSIEGGKLPETIKSDTTFKYDNKDRTYLKVAGPTGGASGYNFLLGEKEQYGIHVDQLNGKSQPLFSVYDYKGSVSLATIRNKEEITAKAKEAKKNISSMKILNAKPDGNSELAEVITDKNIDHYVASNRSVPVNVLSLGVDNTGTTGISDIINEHTQKYALYFPAGRYLVDEPLFIRNPIYGVHAGWCHGSAVETLFVNGITNYSNNNNYSEYNKRFHEEGGLKAILDQLDAKTEVTDKIEFLKSNPCFMIVNLGSYNTLKGFSINCLINLEESSAVGGILDIGGIGNLFEDISIDKLGSSYGICINHSGAGAAYLDNISVYTDNTDLKYSTGIGIRKGTDIRLTNIKSHAWWGIECCNSIYGSNIHTWGGKAPDGLESNPNQDTMDIWYNTSAGIASLQNVYARLDNVYLDTCKNYIRLEGTNKNSLIFINNLMTCDDGRIEQIYKNNNLTCPSNGRLITFGEGSRTISRLFINGGVGLINPNLHGEYLYGIDDISINSIQNFVIEPAVVDGDIYQWTSKYNYIMPRPIYGYSNKYKLYLNDDNKYHEIARVPINNAVQQLTITNTDCSKTIVTIDTASLKITITDNNKEYYYHVQGSENNRQIIIFKKKKGNVWCEITESFTNYDFIPTLSRYVIDSNDTEFKLTEIPTAT